MNSCLPGTLLGVAGPRAGAAFAERRHGRHGLGQKALGLDGAVKIEVQASVEHGPSVTQQMLPDDPGRLSGFLTAVQRCGLLGLSVVCGAHGPKYLQVYRVRYVAPAISLRSTSCHQLD